MSDDQSLIIYIVGGLLAFAFLWRRKEAIEHAVRQTAVAAVFAGIVFLLLWKNGFSPLGAYIGALVVGVLIRRAQPRRSRHISARTKRQAIAKWEKKTGETFNRRIHELDHTLSHSRGGGNSQDNIQVLTRKKNRAKGARLNWWDNE